MSGNPMYRDLFEINASNLSTREIPTIGQFSNFNSFGQKPEQGQGGKFRALTHLKTSIF